MGGMTAIHPVYDDITKPPRIVIMRGGITMYLSVSRPYFLYAGP